MDRENPHFCLVPWTHLHVWPNGTAYPCCIWDSSTPIGNVNEHRLTEIYNAPGMRELRQNILAGQPTAGCNRCYQMEKLGAPTKRTFFNKRFSHLVPLLKATGKDGSIAQPKITSFDIRFSNLCNMRCRTCGPGLSSAWHSDATQAYGDQRHPPVLNVGANDIFWQDIESLLPHVEAIEFAGGEPLIDPRHWDILYRLLSLDRTSTALYYTTNFMLLDYKSQSIFDLWQKFENVHVKASLDASGARAEYMRKGTYWPRIEENRRRMIREIPHVGFNVASTVSLFNAWHLPDFHRDWIERELVRPEEIKIFILTHGPEMSVKSLPQGFKRVVEEKWVSAIQKAEALRQDYLTLVQFMNSENHEYMLGTFMRNNGLIDKIRREELTRVFPELKLLG